MAKRIASDTDAAVAANRIEQAKIVEAYNNKTETAVTYTDANSKAPVMGTGYSIDLDELNAKCLVPSIAEIEPLIDWRMLLAFWNFKGNSLVEIIAGNPEAARTLNEAKAMFATVMEEGLIELVSAIRFFPATKRGNDIVINDEITLPMYRSQCEPYLSLADYFSEDTPSPIGLFIVSAKLHDNYDEKSYEHLMLHALAARVAEAATQWIHHKAFSGQTSIRPAFGYAVCPDHRLKAVAFMALNAEERLGITLTEGYSISPSTSVCGMYIAHPDAHYFPVMGIDSDQEQDYENRIKTALACQK
ncbi:MAG: hypothetical protein KBT09_01985 [Bacteroidales bacterium]|nr:hypothetical protein [Candidatus Sodaliphilus fimicaballi]